MLPAFRVLAKLKVLRGGAFDPFGRTEERRTERKLVADYLGMIDQRIAGLKAEQIPLLARLARLPETIRGFGHVKEANIKLAAAEKARLEAELENSRFAAACGVADARSAFSAVIAREGGRSSTPRRL